jgi:hypothetical protein
MSSYHHNSGLVNRLENMTDDDLLKLDMVDFFQAFVRYSQIPIQERRDRYFELLNASLEEKIVRYNIIII